MSDGRMNPVCLNMYAKVVSRGELASMLALHNGGEKEDLRSELTAT